MNLFRRRLVALVTFIGGLYFFLEFLLPKSLAGFTFGFYHEEILLGVQVVGVMSIGLGIINIFRVYGRAIVKQQRGWFYSLILVVSFVATFAIELWGLLEDEALQARRQQLQACEEFSQQDLSLSQQTSLLSSLGDFATWVRTQPGGSEVDKQTLEVMALVKTGTSEIRTASIAKLLSDFTKLSASLSSASPQKQISRFFYEGFFVPLGSAMFSLLAFYIATAAYRSFRIRSLEASVMMVAALIVILGQIPHGPLYISERLPDVRLWLLANISTPAFRAIFFGTAIASLAMAVRMWLSLERSPLDEEEQ